MTTPAEIQSVIPGIHGLIITTLMGVVVILSGVIVWMQKRADKIYGYRLQERDELNKALNAAAAAQQAQAKATEERNQIQEELAETINSLVSSIALFIERSTINHTHMVADQERQAKVIESIAGAMRDVALSNTSVKDRMDNLTQQIPGMSNDIKLHISNLVRDVENATSKRSR